MLFYRVDRELGRWAECASGASPAGGRRAGSLATIAGAISSQ